MSNDPALEAAQRAIAETKSSPARGLGYWELIVAAREALAPLRELHRPFHRTDYPGADERTVCNHCLGPIDWPCLTARLIYPEGEL